MSALDSPINPHAPILSSSSLPPFFFPHAQGTTGGARAQQYTFSRAFGEASDNDRIFKEAAEAGVEDALRKGTSYLLFSYGACLALRQRKLGKCTPSPPHPPLTTLPPPSLSKQA